MTQEGVSLDDDTTILYVSQTTKGNNQSEKEDPSTSSRSESLPGSFTMYVRSLLMDVYDIKN
jgi:hypothetical protein